MQYFQAGRETAEEPRISQLSEEVCPRISVKVGIEMSIRLAHLRQQPHVCHYVMLMT